ncbi:DUF4893 domain-containing protein [Paracoccus sp. S1E-3]|uniref:DUF4893 domain-containing protein n=1 Tax=Paracoccus sp. S1E-3 TaxID=2756130 RepID=UPI0015EEDE86|nr:DUF4893 domain-containing protein [Paracoccus sp. S1E-3]MBA4489584.1 DUF4893 domain-containing protein [Paracoccus sp. S1E-3]
MRKPILILAALLLSLPAHAQDGADRTLPDGARIRPDDSQKLAQFDSFYGAALRTAFATGQAADIATLTGALTGPPMPPAAAMEALKGDWKCRMMKAGDMTALVIYDNFDCSFDGARFSKETGSQQTVGTIHTDGDRLIYLGTGYVQGSEVPAYADLPEDPLNAPGMGQNWADIAVVEVVSDRRARLIFPDPALESQLNVLYLTR